MEALFDNVTGLTKGDKVYVQGVDVGRVKSMSINKDGVLVAFTMKYEVNLREDYSILVKATSALGGKYVEVNEGSRALPLYDISKGIVGQEPVDMIGEAAETLKSLRGSLEDGGILANVEIAMENLRKVSEDIEAGEGTIGKLISDDTVYDDLKGITDNLKSVSERLEKGEGTLGKLLSSDETIYNDLKGTVASLNEMIGRVNEGEGTLGKLVNDEGLYDEIMKTLTEVRSMIDDIRETSPVTSMTSILFGAF